VKRTPLSRKTPLRKQSAKKKAKIATVSAPKASKLCKNAEGKKCTLRLPGCDGGGETTVFAHYRRFGWGGMGMKPNDLLGCFACYSCHEKQEHYHPDCTYEDMLRAMGETLMIQSDDGMIQVNGA
jgi:hypothetical protein